MKVMLTKIEFKNRCSQRKVAFCAFSFVNECYYNSPSPDQMVILQDSARIFQKLPILEDLAKKMVILQGLAEKRLSCKICQKNGYLARFLQVRSGRAVLLVAFIHATHFFCAKIYLRNRCVFLKKNNKFS